MYGKIHSVETFGTVDGPGIRYVLFLQGCPMRCLYCHNPDTWNMDGITKREPDEIINDYLKYEPYLRGGGITVTGGEPMLQMDFLIELFSKAKRKRIHTCIDTSGIVYNPDSESFLSKLDLLMSVTDLVMLDIKHIDKAEHLKLTGQDNARILAFARYLDNKKVSVWIRHVVVPGITDKEEYLVKLGEFLASLNNVKALDVLPYHDMGKVKYEKLGIDYALKDVKPLSKEAAIKARNIIISAMKSKTNKYN